MAYAQAVVSGEISACKWVRLACKRQLTDLDNQRTDDFPYWFDDDAAEDVCEFIENLTHIKGEKAREPIQLEPWQSFCLTVQFGWKRVADDCRRFRAVFMLEPRKNGKSTIEAAVALYMLTQDGEEGAEVYCGATSEKQALFVFQPAWLMVQRDDEMQDALGLSLTGTYSHPTGIHCEAMASSFTPLIGKPGDGGNPHCAIVDEFHEHQSPEMVNAMRLGMGIRKQPMLRQISTAGNDISGPCYQAQLEAQAILEGQVTGEDVFAIIYGIDDDDSWDTLEAAIKANPNYGVSITERAILSDLEEALRSPLKQAEYKTKHLNIWVGSREPFFNLESWLALTDEKLNEEDFYGDPCWMASDAGDRNDLFSTARWYRRMIDGNAHYYIFCSHYAARDWIESPDNPNKQYLAWMETGWLTGTDGGATDLNLVQSEILEQSKRCRDCRLWAYDPWHLRQMEQGLAEAGLVTVEVAQIPKNLSEPMKEWKALIDGGRCHHNGDPILSWAISNVTARPDAKDNVFPRKERYANKIDPAVAGITGLSRAIIDEGKESSLQEHGIRYI